MVYYASRDKHECYKQMMKLVELALIYHRPIAKTKIIYSQAKNTYYLVDDKPFKRGA